MYIVKVNILPWCCQVMYLFINIEKKFPILLLVNFWSILCLNSDICTSRFPHNLIHSFKKNINGIVGIGNGIDKSFRCSNDRVSNHLSAANGCLCFKNKWQVSDIPVLRYITDELCIKSYLHFSLIGQRYPKDSPWNLTCMYIYFENCSSYIHIVQSNNVLCIIHI